MAYMQMADDEGDGRFVGRKRNIFHAIFPRNDGTRVEYAIDMPISVLKVFILFFMRLQACRLIRFLSSIYADVFRYAGTLKRLIRDDAERFSSALVLALLSMGRLTIDAARAARATL